MKRYSILLGLFLATASLQTWAAPEVLSLDAEEMREMDLEQIPPFPAEIVLKGKSENWQQVLHQGDFVVAVFEASAADIEVSEPFPYDEFVMVLEGEVILTAVGGEKKTYQAGETFLLPKGWVGTWAMPARYREMVIIETRAFTSGGF
jgi:uncharacterized cupin superfamily protein